MELFSVGCGLHESTHPLSLSLAGMLTRWLPSLPVFCPFWSLPLPGDRLVLAVLTRTCPVWGGDMGVPTRSCHQRIPAGRKEPVLGKASFASYSHLRNLNKKDVLQG